MRLQLSYDQPLVQPQLDALDAGTQHVESGLPEGLEAAFQGNAQYRTAHSSSVIEGNPLTFQAALPFMTDETQPTTAAQQELRQLNEAYDHGYRWASDPHARFDEGVIRTLHSVLLKGADGPAGASRGAYRLKGVRIGRGVQTFYVGPSPDLVPELMAAFVADLNAWIEQEPGPIAAALAHFGLVSIHPFEDGNGRAARLVADLVLERTGASVRRMVSISEQILKADDDYRAVLRRTQGPTFVEAVDVTEFVRFHVSRELAAVELLEQGVIAVRETIAQLMASMGPEIHARQRFSTAIVYMTLVGPISSSQYARLCRCSQATATNDLRLLAHAGGVRQEGGGRSTRYRLTS